MDLFLIKETGMKNIKSLLIGFLSCLCMILFMGQTDSESFEMQVSNGNIHISDEYGQFQGFASRGEIFLIDTKSADTWIWQSHLKLWERQDDANIQLINHYENYEE